MVLFVVTTDSKRWPAKGPEELGNSQLIKFISSLTPYLGFFLLFIGQKDAAQIH